MLFLWFYLLLAQTRIHPSQYKPSMDMHSDFFRVACPSDGVRVTFDYRKNAGTLLRFDQIRNSGLYVSSDSKSLYLILPPHIRGVLKITPTVPLTGTLALNWAGLSPNFSSDGLKFEQFKFEREDPESHSSFFGGFSFHSTGLHNKPDVVVSVVNGIFSEPVGYNYKDSCE